MKSYQSFGALARALERVSLKLPDSLGAAMEAAAVLVQETAKAEIGTYQAADMGPFTSWAPLKESTVKEKRTLGYADDENDNPLLRTGEMRDSISHVYDWQRFTFVVGATSEIAVYQELGTSRGIPPRPFLAPALYRNIPEIRKIIGATIESTLAGK